jgi:hypothetical protein
MLFIAATIRDIALLRVGPDKMPYSRNLMLGLAVLYVLLNVLVTSVRLDSFEVVLLLSVGEVLLFSGYLYLVLRFWRLQARYVQTLSSTLGCGILLTALGLPVTLAAQAASEQAGNVSFYGLLYVILVVWSFVVVVNILRHALATRVQVSIVLNLLYLILSFELTTTILVATGTEI